MFKPLVAALCLLGAAIPAATAQQGPPPGAGEAPTGPQLVPPPVRVERAMAMSAADLAFTYLQVQQLIPTLEFAREPGVRGTVHFEGPEYVVTAGNVDAYIAAYHGRLEVYRQAMQSRGLPEVGGDYRIEFSSECAGDILDPRELFVVQSASGERVPVDTAQLVQAGVEVKFLMEQPDQALGTFFAGAAVEDTIVFSDELTLGFALLGTVVDDTVQLRFDVAELRAVFGSDTVSAERWLELADCVVTLSPR